MAHADTGHVRTSQPVGAWCAGSRGRR
jgi:hypothetical protein